MTKYEQTLADARYYVLTAPWPDRAAVMLSYR